MTCVSHFESISITLCSPPRTSPPLSLCSQAAPTVGPALLSALLPLGSELLSVLPSRSKLLPAFKDYFNSLVLLAGTNKVEGHVLLVKSVEKWLPECADVLKDVSDIEEKQELALPAGSLVQYLAHLMTAVQFITNMVKCTERRNLAGDSEPSLTVR